MAAELEALANDDKPVSDAGKQYLSNRAQRYPEEQEVIGYVVNDRLPPTNVLENMGGGGPKLIE
jgi:hypothetical protein